MTEHQILAKAKNHLEQKQPREAANLLRTGLTTDFSPSSDYLYFLGFSLFRSNQFSEAQVWLDQACKKDSTNIKAAYCIGRCYEKSGSSANAIVIYKECLAKPGCPAFVRKRLDNLLHAPVSQNQAPSPRPGNLPNVLSGSGSRLHVPASPEDRAELSGGVGEIDAEAEVARFDRLFELAGLGSNKGKWFLRAVIFLVALILVLALVGLLVNILRTQSMNERTPTIMDGANASQSNPRPLTAASTQQSSSDYVNRRQDLVNAYEEDRRRLAEAYEPIREQLINAFNDAETKFGRNSIESKRAWQDLQEFQQKTGKEFKRTEENLRIRLENLKE